MKIVSLNLWGGRSAHYLDRWLNEIQADVYCFQEVFSSPKNRNILLEDGDGQVVMTDLLNLLKDALPNYTCLFSPGSRGYINDSTWISKDIEYGIAIFVKSEWIVPTYISDIVHGPFRFSNQGSPPLSRTAQVIRCITPQGPIVIGNIHGLWDPNGKRDTKQRFFQAQLFNNLIKKIEKEKDPIVLCGDFNVLPNSSTFDLMFNRPFRNLILDFQVESTRTIHHKKEIKFADYILITEDFITKSFVVPQSPVISDHCPLIFEFDIHTRKSKDFKINELTLSASFKD